MFKNKFENEAFHFHLDNDDQCPDKQTNFYQFKEYDTLIGLIDKLPENLKNQRDKEKSREHFLLICDKYREQPHLVDLFLRQIFEKLIQIVKSNMSDLSNDELTNEAFKYMFLLTKLRGYKNISPYMPHGDSTSLLNLLAQQNPADGFTWQTRYMLLIWLSIVCMKPLEVVDEVERNSLNQRILDICMVNHN